MNAASTSYEEDAGRGTAVTGVRERRCGTTGTAAELRGVFETVSAGAVDDAARQVNALLVRTGARPELERHDGEPWHLHFHAADRPLPNGWAAACATGLAVVLGGSRYDPLGVCTRPGAKTAAFRLAWHEPGGCPGNVVPPS